MWLILLEALGALAVLVFLVWWTMFSGRKGGELALPPSQDKEEGGEVGGPGGDGGSKGP